MSFTLHYLYDIFISYASADNAAPGNVAPGLVAAFHRELTVALGQLGVRDGLEIFFDQGDIEDGSPISEQLLTAARSSAVMIAFHSPAYDRSTEWCQREFYEFREAREAGRDWENHFFLISLNRDTPPTRSPVFGAFRERHHLSFFRERGQDWFPFRPDRPEAVNPEGFNFSEEVFRLARQIVPKLEALRDAAPIRKVFLTCASETFKPQIKAIKTDLTAQGFHVLQTSPWIDPFRRREDAERLIARADLVIGIEEKFAANDEAGEHAAEQLAIARRPPPRPELRWLPGDGRHGFAPAEEAERKQRPEVRAVPLEEFKKMVSDRLKAPVGPVAGLVAGGGGPPGGGGGGAAPGPRAELVLVVCSPDDESRTLDQMLGILEGVPPVAGRVPAGTDGYPDPLPEIEADSVEAWCRAIKERLDAVNPTRVLFIDGLCSRDWIDDRLRRFLILQRELQLPGAVCDCEPLAKPLRRRFRPRGRIEFLSYDDLARLQAWIFS